MGWFTAGAVYVVIWFLVLFAVLPFGIRPLDPDDIGAASGAPANPRLLLRFAVTTVVAAVFWGAFLYAVDTGLLNLRPEAYSG